MSPKWLVGRCWLQFACYQKLRIETRAATSTASPPRRQAAKLFTAARSYTAEFTRFSPLGPSKCRCHLERSLPSVPDLLRCTCGSAVCVKCQALGVAALSSVPIQEMANVCPWGLGAMRRSHTHIILTRQLRIGRGQFNGCARLGDLPGVTGLGNG